MGRRVRLLALSAIVLISWGQVPATPTWPRVALGSPTSKTVLQPSDFTYLGYYDIQTNGSNTTYSQGLAHRYVGGDLRLLIWQLGGELHEISLAGKTFGQRITTTTTRWTNIGGLADFKAFWWDEPLQRLWSTAAVDYTDQVVPTQIYTRTLNANGTISNLHGPVSLQGINAKRVYGGATAVPLWFQQQYGVGPYAVGFGGYTSLVEQGGGAAIGPTLYTMPDPAGYANSATVPVGPFRTLMDWAPASQHRGARVTIPINYFDGGDPRQNPSTPPTDPPLSTAQWLSPAPDGTGYMVWGDAYYNTGNWIDTPTKHGFIAIASLCKGKCWYQSSTLHYDGRQFELHIFDPADFGAVLQGQKQPWQIRPSAWKELLLPGLGTPWNGNTPVGNVGGATYDPVGKRLYLVGFGVNSFDTRLYVFQVSI